MKFDSKRLKDKVSEDLSFQETLVIPSDYQAEKDQAELRFEGRVSKQPDFYTLEGVLTATLYFFCDRCLERTAFPLRIDVLEAFADKDERRPQPESFDSDFQTGAVKPEDVYEVENGILDFAPAMEALICLNMPLKILCSEDCKGLCPVCGGSLNHGDCGCDRTVRDPRFDLLRSLDIVQNKEHNSKTTDENKEV